ACDLNATNVCTRLAMSYEDKEHARYNIKKSIELYEKACALNDIRACDGLGFLYTRSESFMKPNEALSLKYFMKTCELAPYTCEKIATAYETGNKLKKNIDNAIKFYEKACDNNLTQSCSKLGRIHLENQNYKTALPFLIKACESKEDWSCTQVAKVYENGNKEVLKDKEKSVLFYDKACDFGSRTSCKNLALKYLSEENPAKNMHKVLHYFVKACDKADADACREVALIYKSGKNGVKINKMRSLNFFSKACNYGNEKSCKLKQ
ncbi:MAG TPA: sel1 repeat family protein, partial [Bacteroidetes bacterium]|nr:sel1 repeat family protein [Bacteroidota bacterium]